MELHLTGRGEPVTERLREVTERKLIRLERMEPKLTRLEIEIISERNPRQGGAHRVEAVADTPRKTFRARADAREVEDALDVIAEKLERQIRDHHKKRQARVRAGTSRVRSAQTAPNPGREGSGPGAGQT